MDAKNKVENEKKKINLLYTYLLRCKTCAKQVGNITYSRISLLAIVYHKCYKGISALCKIQYVEFDDDRNDYDYADGYDDDVDGDDNGKDGDDHDDEDCDDDGDDDDDDGGNE